MSEGDGAAVPVAEAPKGILASLFERERVLLFLGIFIAEMTIYLFGMFAPIDVGTRQSLYNQTNSAFGFLSTASPVQVTAYIFIHNLQIALYEMVPLVGVYYFVLSIFTTGLATQAIVVSLGYPSWFGLVLFAFPYSVVELSAYAVALTSGIMVLAAWRRKRLGREGPVFVAEALLVGAILLLAASMETLTRYDLTAGLALWLPLGAVAAGYAIARRRRA